MSDITTTTDDGYNGRWWADAMYACVYRTIYEDPKLKAVVEDDAMLGAWLHLLMAAERTFPEPAPIPRRTDAARLAALVEAGVIELQPADRYTFHGLDLERAHRKDRYSAGGLARAAQATHDPQTGHFLARSTSVAGSVAGSNPIPEPISPASLDQRTSKGKSKEIQVRDTGNDRVPATSTTTAMDGPWMPFVAAWTARGLRKLPTPKQRAALWDAVDNYPTACGRWVAEAPGNVSVGAIVGYVLDQYHQRRDADGTRP
jgi:hypothetical protein